MESQTEPRRKFWSRPASRVEQVIVSLKSLQLAVSISVVVLFWLIYPGVMVAIASAAGLCYLLSSIMAILDRRTAIWLAFAFTMLTAVLSTLGVIGFVSSGFDFIAGHHDQQNAFYLPPYLFVAIAICATIVVLMHLIAWRWVIHGSNH